MTEEVFLDFFNRIISEAEEGKINRSTLSDELELIVRNENISLSDSSIANYSKSLNRLIVNYHSEMRETEKMPRIYQDLAKPLGTLEEGIRELYRDIIYNTTN
jgi:hypothetical protein